MVGRSYPLNYFTPPVNCSFWCSGCFPKFYVGRKYSQVANDQYLTVCGINGRRLIRFSSRLSHAPFSPPLLFLFKSHFSTTCRAVAWIAKFSLWGERFFNLFVFFVGTFSSAFPFVWTRVLILKKKTIFERWFSWLNGNFSSGLT